MTNHCIMLSLQHHQPRQLQDQIDQFYWIPEPPWFNLWQAAGKKKKGENKGLFPIKVNKDKKLATVWAYMITWQYSTVRSNNKQRSWLTKNSFLILTFGVPQKVPNHKSSPEPQNKIWFSSPNVTIQNCATLEGC